MGFSNRWPAPEIPHHHPTTTVPQDPYNPQFYNPLQHHNPSPAAPTYSHYPYYSQNPNPNPSLTPDPQTATKYGNTLDPLLRTPGIDPYSSNSYVSHVGFESQGLPYTHYQQSMQQSGGPMAATYYQDSVGHSWAAKEAGRQFGLDPVDYASGIRPPNGTQSTAALNPNPMYQYPQMSCHYVKGAMRKALKKIKVVQSAWCELCKIDCTSKEVLDQHKLGKKHRKNLEKLEESKKAATSATTPAAAMKPKVPNPVKKENPSAEKGKNVGASLPKRKDPTALEAGEDLQAKKRKLLQCGAAEGSVRVCVICNVVCNSETVFNYHLTGQKHAAQVKKQAEGALVTTTSGPQAVTAA